MASNPDSESVSPSTSTSKISIPRLSIREVAAGPRTRKACKECRIRKAKCDGHQPCSRCAACGVECLYIDGKRETMERRYQDLESRVQAYEKVLRRVQFRVPPEEGDLIAQTLAHYGLSTEVINTVTDHAHLSATEDDTVYAIECVQEDLHSSKTLQPIGFIGGPSELSWIQDLNQEVEKYTISSEGISPKEVPTNDSEVLSRVSYFLDDQELAIYGNIDLQTQPPQGVAERLLCLYFQTVHLSFPIISKLSFTQQVGRYYANPNLRPPNKWLAILNLVFAAAAKFAHLVPQHLMQSMDSPTEYFSRAQQLATAENPLTEHPNLQQVQIEGLTAFLCMVFGHINRSWRVCGIAIRSSIAMGINLRNQSKEISNTSREIRYRVWWSLYTLENTLSVMTGRPTGTSDRFCTTPLPIPFEEEQFHRDPAARLLADSGFRAEYMGDFAFFGCTPANRPPNTDKIGGRRPGSKLQDIIPNTSRYFLYFVELTKIMRQALARFWISCLIFLTESGWLRCLHGGVSYTTSCSQQPYC
ncbi:fungal-specific transcription factor domain-domain-containing protein [Aspergillus welwitschiae]|uniref:Fungal-specific transcription factor domain-domain-containing protein n=1 Tax=Aspergillus welwitschiae TaxID=1341132 RepID=A0A3F3PIS3_9EURO|nr:fungal-specific transcription factor domain-domain-containing protein [Aspergillus welwitschiae]RDH26850.1 fungal-specific transcription factor domain-domain-containing protein [Aspergillus welwitschiae]